MPPWCAPLVTLTLSHSQVCPNILSLGPFYVSPTLAKPPSFLPSNLLNLPPTPFVVSSLPLRSPPLPEYHPRYLSVILVSGLPHPWEGASCRDTTSGLRFVPVPLSWGVLVDHWSVRSTSVYCSMLPSSGQPLLVPQFPPLHYSPSVYCPPTVLPETASSTPIVLFGPSCVSTSGQSSDLPNSKWTLKSTWPSTDLST